MHSIVINNTQNNTNSSFGFFSSLFFNRWFSIRGITHNALRLSPSCRASRANRGDYIFIVQVQVIYSRYMNKLLFYRKHYGKYVCCVWLYTPFDRRGQWFEVFRHSKDRKTPRKPDRRTNNWTTEIMASTYQQSKLWPRSHETALQSVFRTFYNR